MSYTSSYDTCQSELSVTCLQDTSREQRGNIWNLRWSSPRQLPTAHLFLVQQCPYEASLSSNFLCPCTQHNSNDIIQPTTPVSGHRFCEKQSSNKDSKCDSFEDPVQSDRCSTLWHPCAGAGVAEWEGALGSMYQSGQNIGRHSLVYEDMESAQLFCNF